MHFLLVNLLRHVCKQNALVCKTLFRLTFPCSKSTTETLRKGINLCSKLTITTPKRHSGLLIVNLEHISQLFYKVSIVSWVVWNHKIIIQHSQYQFKSLHPIQQICVHSQQGNRKFNVIFVQR